MPEPSKVRHPPLSYNSQFTAQFPFVQQLHNSINAALALVAADMVEVDMEVMPNDA
jgi:hypothetical protein